MKPEKKFPGASNHKEHDLKRSASDVHVEIGGSKYGQVLEVRQL